MQFTGRPVEGCGGGHRLCPQQIGEAQAPAGGGKSEFQEIAALMTGAIVGDA